MVVLNFMVESQVGVDCVAYNAAISACGRGGEWLKAPALLDTMALSTVEMDTVTFGAAISACEIGGHWVKALELLATMLQRTMQVNVIANTAAAMGHFQERALEPDAVTCSSVICACDMGGQWSR